MQFVVGLLLAMLALPGAAHAQSSQKPLQIIVPFAPGGSADGIGRILATELSAKLGRQVYVENKPGAGGSLGLTILAKAAARRRHHRDRRDRRAGDQSACAGIDRLRSGQGARPGRQADRHPAPHRGQPQDRAEDGQGHDRTIEGQARRLELRQHRREFEPASLGGDVQEGDRRQSRPHSLSRQRPGGTGRRRRRRAARPRPTSPPPTRTSRPAISPRSASRALSRSKLAPEIPTLAEGGVPGFNGAPGFIGMVAPLGTPPAVIRQLSSEIAAIVARPDVQAKIATLSVEPAYADEASVRRRSRR